MSRFDSRIASYCFSITLSSRTIDLTIWMSTNPLLTRTKLKSHNSEADEMQYDWYNTPSTWTLVDAPPLKSYPPPHSLSHSHSHLNCPEIPAINVRMDQWRRPMILRMKPSSMTRKVDPSHRTLAISIICTRGAPFPNRKSWASSKIVILKFHTLQNSLHWCEHVSMWVAYSMSQNVIRACAHVFIASSFHSGVGFPWTHRSTPTSAIWMTVHSGNRRIHIRSTSIFPPRKRQS